MQRPEQEIRTTVASAPVDANRNSNDEETRLMGQTLKRFVIAILLLSLCFAVPLWQLLRFSLASQFFSYILLIPFISGYLIWTNRARLRMSAPSKGIAGSIAGAALLVLGCYFLLSRQTSDLLPADRLALLILPFVLLVHAAAAFFLGRQGLKSAAFPLLFLLFMIPLPSFVENGLVAFLQHASAEAAYFLINITGIPVLRDGLMFVLPGIRLEVAPECSGIRSTMVLVLTSLLAGHFFLRSAWSRSILVVAVVLLGIARNAVRIMTLAQLCVHISPTMIDSPIHHRGGPIFFVISLVPLLVLVWYLRRVERRKSKEA